MVLFSLCLFYFKPQLFYWRPWEFFDEIVYSSPGCKVKWKGFERGDQSRRYILFDQEKWKTKVSCNSDGFRSVPFKTDEYPILVVGDSHSWGSGLSDNETLPWVLSEKLNIPVFNGARGYKMLDGLLSYAPLKKTKLIIELTQTSMLCKKNLRIAFDEHFEIKDYKPISKKKPLKDILVPQRFFLPAKILRPFGPSVLCRTLKKSIGSHFPQTYDSGKNLDDLEFVVDAITQRAKEFADLGYEYLFIPVPMQQSIMLDSITESTVWWEKELINRLTANHVHAIELISYFLEHKNEGLYFTSDSHWNKKGVEYAVSKIIPYIIENSLIAEQK